MIGTEEVICFLLSSQYLLYNLLFAKFLSFWYCGDSEAVFACCGFLDYDTM
jgi:hypothetical protein